jgi:hypothetical protein
MLSPKREDAIGNQQSNHHCKKGQALPHILAYSSCISCNSMCSEGHETSTTKVDAVHSSKTSATSYQTTWRLFIYGLFNDTFNTALYIALNDRMISE